MAMTRILLLALIVLGVPALSQAQSVFGLKGGLLLGSQKWNHAKRDPIISYSGYMWWDFQSSTSSNLMFQMGYRRPGSAIRTRNAYVAHSGGVVTEIPSMTREFAFHNVSFMFGGKSRYFEGPRFTSYYLIGGRLDINVAHKNEFYGDFQDFVQWFTYGINVGTGIEIPIGNSDLVVELQLAPDLAPQIHVPAGMYYNPYTYQTTPMPEQRIHNFAGELMLGWRFNAR